MFLLFFFCVVFGKYKFVETVYCVYEIEICKCGVAHNVLYLFERNKLMKQIKNMLDT